MLLGWIKKDLESLSDTHLGLDLNDYSKIESISQDILENIDITLLMQVASEFKSQESEEYPQP